jgi:hypothetical protein
VSAIRGVAPLSGVYRIPAGGLFKNVFGTNEEERKNASPIVHVCKDHPPFLIVYADKDFPTCDQVSQEMCEALKKCDCSAGVREIKGRDHITIIARAIQEEDPTAQALLEFIAAHSDLKLKEKTSSQRE